MLYDKSTICRFQFSFDTSYSCRESLDKQKDVHDFNKFLEDRYLEKAKEKLNEEGKDFGTANIFDGNQKVKIELQKVEWDQENLTKFLMILLPKKLVI